MGGCRFGLTFFRPCIGIFSGKRNFRNPTSNTKTVKLVQKNRITFLFIAISNLEINIFIDFICKTGFKLWTAYLEDTSL